MMTWRSNWLNNCLNMKQLRWKQLRFSNWRRGGTVRRFMPWRDPSSSSRCPFLLWQRSSYKCTVNNCLLILELFSHLGPNDTNRDNNGVTSSNMENSISFILHGCKNKTYQQKVFDRYKECFYSFFLLWTFVVGPSGVNLYTNSLL